MWKCWAVYAHNKSIKLLNNRLIVLRLITTEINRFISGLFLKLGWTQFEAILGKNTIKYVLNTNTDFLKIGDVKMEISKI